VREQVADLKTQADRKVVEAQQAQQAATSQKTKVEGLISDQKSAKASIAKERKSEKASLDQNAADIQNAQSQVAALAAKIKARNAARAKAAAKRAAEAAAAQRRAAANAAKNHSSSSNGSGAGASSSGGSSSGGYTAPAASGILAWPVANSYVTSSFGMRMHPIYHVVMFHSGTDLHAPCGTPIHAAAAGSVVYASWNGGYGNRVIVDHGLYHSHELFTTYNHMERYAVHVGEHVAQGQTVGYAGDFGASTACHLHFEVMEDGSFENPMNFLSPTDPFH
jgi:murein DD-endopeptidase MepM/ murein hydrolase activator NlpD